MRLWIDGTCCSGNSIAVNSVNGNVVRDACNNSRPEYDLAMNAGQVVHIEIGCSPSGIVDFTLRVAPPPGDCEHAFVIDAPGSSLYSDYFESPYFNDDCVGDPTNDRFYVFTAPYDGLFFFDMTGSGHITYHGTTMRLWLDGACCSGASVTVYDFDRESSVPMHDLGMWTGQTVYIEVGTRNFGYYQGTPDGYYNLRVQSSVRDSTLDICPGRVITALPYVDNGSTEIATNQFSYSGCSVGEAPDVVYNFAPADSMMVRASMSAAWPNTMHVRKNNCATGTVLYCDIGINPDSAWFDFWAEPDSTYYFFLDGHCTPCYGPYTFSLINWSCPAPDSLTILKSGEDIILRWPSVNCDTPTYHVYRANTSDVTAIPANEITVTADTTYADLGILNDPGDKFFYIVTASH